MMLAAGTVAADYEALFEMTFEQAATGIAHIDIYGKWIRINQRLCRMLGFSHSELMALSLAEITHAEDRFNDHGLKAALREGRQQRYQIEKRLLTKKGRALWVSLSASLARQPGLGDEIFVVIIEDIQLQKEAEATIRLHRAQLQLMYDNLEAGVVMSGLDGTLLYWNQQAREMHGYDANSPDAGVGIAELFKVFQLSTLQGHLLPLSDWPLMRVLCGERLRGLELQVRRADKPGWERRYRYRGSLALDNSGKAVMALVIISKLDDAA